MKSYALADQGSFFIERAPETRTSVPSLIKWTGSKRLLAPQIRSLFPAYTRYIEPFVGGGSLLYLSATPGSIASDVYRPLVELWSLLKKSPSAVTDDYAQQWQLLNRELDQLDPAALPEGATLPQYYYKVRERFNRTGNPLDLNFILRTCVNGIVRFNDKGEFNNSFHLSRRGMTPSRFAAAVRAWRPTLDAVTFQCCDYADTLRAARRGDLVYLDPPYANSKNRYAEDLDLARLFSELELLNTRGVSWALSFDGSRGGQDMLQPVPRELYRRHALISGGLSAVKRVLSGPLEEVQESLYLNF